MASETSEAEDEEIQRYRLRHKVNIDGIGGMGWLFFLGLLFLLSYDSEIRCSMGNKTECAKMEVKTK